MQTKKLSASELARQIWGTTKDKRGYDVARNRDRIGHYLAGTSYPEPVNLEAIARVLDVPVEDFAIERGLAPETPLIPHHGRRSTGALIMTSLTDHPTKTRLQVDRVIHWKLAMKIHQMLKQAENCEYGELDDEAETPQPGEVIQGSKA